MPLYEEQCKRCGYVNERLSGITEKTMPCPKCGSTTERLYSLAALSIFDGFVTTNIDREGRPTQVRSKRDLSNLCHSNGVVPAEDAPPPRTRFEKIEREVPKW
jgi:putative FmdB family regulatory protein